MAKVKITETAAINAATLAPEDLIPVVDVSDTTMSSTGTNKAVTVAELVTEMNAAHLADTDDAHDASAISVLDTANNYTGTNVETVLAELPGRFAPLVPLPAAWPETYQDNWFHAGCDISSSTALSGNIATFRRHWFPAGYQITRLGVSVAVVGTSGSVIRLGVYDDVKGVPTNLIADAGTQSGTATGYNPITTAITIPSSGYYHLIAVPQGAPATNPTLRLGRPVQPSKFPTSSFIIDGNFFTVHYRVGLTGALPNPLGGVAADSSVSAICIAFSGVNP